MWPFPHSSEGRLYPPTGHDPDSVIETENAVAGKAFGDRQMEQVVRNHRLHPASELSHQVLSELQRWRPPAVSQQDDLTLIVVDVL
jgi:serine phosphatase RsbU (regulator of sigma subunit)